MVMNGGWFIIAIPILQTQFNWKMSCGYEFMSSGYGNMLSTTSKNLSVKQTKFYNWLHDLRKNDTICVFYPRFWRVCFLPCCFVDYSLLHHTSISDIGWWFRTSFIFLFFHILGIISPNHLNIFRRAWNHQQMFWSAQGGPLHEDCARILEVTHPRGRDADRQPLWDGGKTQWKDSIQKSWFDRV